MELMDLFIDGFYYYYFYIYYLFYSVFNPYFTLYSTITIEDIKWKLNSHFLVDSRVMLVMEKIICAEIFFMKVL